jgi:hypothetical protein
MISLSSEFGKNLVSRKVGAQLRSALLSSNEPVEIDFSDVHLMNHSFADEVFGKLVAERGIDVFKNYVFLKNVSENDRQMIKAVVRERQPAKAG